jgi:hypothetical protein
LLLNYVSFINSVATLKQKWTRKTHSS